MIRIDFISMFIVIPMIFIAIIFGLEYCFYRKAVSNPAQDTIYYVKKATNYKLAKSIICIVAVVCQLLINRYGFINLDLLVGVIYLTIGIIGIIECYLSKKAISNSRQDKLFYIKKTSDFKLAIVYTISMIISLVTFIFYNSIREIIYISRVPCIFAFSHNDLYEMFGYYTLSLLFFIVPGVIGVLEHFFEKKSVLTSEQDSTFYTKKVSDLKLTKFISFIVAFIFYFVVTYVHDDYIMVTLCIGAYFGICFFWGFVTKTINKNKGYEGGFWWGFCLGIIGVIIVACKANKSERCSNTNIADELLKYKSLLDQGVITQEEFEQKKKELMKS